MNNMIDLLLEEVESELEQDFSNYLEDYNIAVMLEEEQQQNNQQNQQQQQQQNNQQNQQQQQQNNQQNQQQQQQDNQQNQQQKPNMTEGIKQRLNKIFDGADGFISKYVGKIEAGFKSLSNKIRGSETYKLADEISLEAIEFLSVPKQVCKAGDDLGYVLSTVDKWTGGLIGNMKNRGTELKNAAQQGLKGKQEPTLMDKFLKQCNSIIEGLNNSMGSIGQGFASIWKSIKATFQGGNNNVKKEHVFLTLEEEVDYLLSESDNMVFLTLDEEVDYLLS